MFDNLTVVAGLIILFWLGVLVAYIIVSRQQTGLQQEIDNLEKQVDKLEKQA
jgi:hypothetical protein